VNQSNGSAEPAIVVRDVVKHFKLYKDRRTNLKEVFTQRRRGTRYDVFPALKGVSLDIPRGSTFALIGHNGSGKSTLLKLIAGIHKPTSSTIQANGRISALLELGAGFHPELSGRDNIYLNGAILGMTRRQIDAAMDTIVEFSGIREFIDTPVKVYSSGMYVRLGFSIAVNLDPEILIVDEVIAVGDEEFQRRCFDHLYELRRKGVTIVLVSHSLSLVQTLCTQAAWLDHGVLREVGPAGEVAQAYLREVNQNERDSDAARDAADGGEPAETDPTAESARQGSHEMVITDVEFLDAQGRAGTRAVAGERLRIRVSYEAREPIESPVFGLGIYTENDTYVTGVHMRMADLDMGVVTGTGHVDYVFDSLPLNPGTYLVTAAVTDWSLAHRYDYWDRAFSLHVRPGSAPEYHGLTQLGGHWSVPSPVPSGVPAQQ
jgi:lipopolysaccharide transport system ATP-binding protein